MSNSTETYRVEPTEDDCGSVYTFCWSTGHLSAKHDNGYSENWPPRGYSVQAKALSYFALTDQTERYLMLDAEMRAAGM